MPKQLQIGVIAYRNPDTDEFMPSIPLYRLETPELKAQQAFLETAFKNLIAVGLIEYVNSNTTTPTPKGRGQKKEF